MKKSFFKGTVGVIMLIMVASCAPITIPPPTPVAPAPLQSVPTTVISSQETAWAKIEHAARQEGKLVVYSFSLVGDSGLQVKENLRRATGLSLELVTGGGASLIERIKTERRGGFQVASVLDTSVILLHQAKLEGITQAIGPLPELSSKEAWRISPQVDIEGHILAMTDNLIGPVINTRLIKSGEEPHSWYDMLAPRWRGQIAMADPDTTPATVNILYYLTRYAGFGEDYIRQLGQKVILQPNNRMNAEFVARGQAPLSFAIGIASTGPFVVEGAPLKPIDMTEGLVTLRSNAMVLLGNAPHPNAARVYLNWRLSKEGNMAFHEVNGTKSLRRDVPNFEPSSIQLSPQKARSFTTEDEVEVARLQRERVFKKLLAEK